MKHQKNWIGRNWKWVLAVWLGLGATGCLIAFIAMQNSEPRQMAIVYALAARLGHPLKFGWYSSGSIEVSEAAGHAELSFGVSGPKGKGSLYVEARETDGIWGLDTLNFGDGREADAINLLAENPAGGSQHQP